MSLINIRKFMINWRKPTIFVLLYLSGSKIPRNLRIIQKLVKSSKREIRKYQEEKLKKLLFHAYKNVPYYQRVLKESGVITKSGKVDLKKFSNIPILTKDIIREEGKNLYSKDYKRRGYYKNTSGGSTGEPVEFIQDKKYSDWNDATKIFYFNSLGHDWGDPEIKLWGSDRDIIKGNLSLKDRATNYLYNRRFFNCYNFSKNNMISLLLLHNSYRPVGYWSYMEAMSEFADFIVENNLKVFSPKYIVSTIGPLEENVRKKISQAFSCSVFDQYGSREMGFIAAEFPENEGKLSFPWFNYVENTNGLVKNVIVTNLVNFSMPLIRYDIGDAAIVNNGNIKRLCGRTLGFFYKKDGSLIHTHFLVQTLFFVEWIKRFQIIQPNFRSIEIKVEKKENVLISPRSQREILQKVKKLIGDEVECKIKFVKRIHPQKNGKYAYTICKIPKENLKKLREQK